MEEKVLIINTGGTIGMVNSEPGNENSPLRPAESWAEIAKEHPILERYRTDYIQLPNLIDSSNMSPKIWIEIANIIKKYYEKYKGFVVLHGTDTMAYTASGISFMLKNLGKPVIFTGSQVPLNFARSDALQNLITSIEIAGNELYGIRNVPEVCIFFRDTLLRGNRSRKIDATNYFGFSSPNYSALGDIGADIRIKKDKIREIYGEFSVDACADENVLIIELFPGISPKHLKSIVDGIEDLKGIILRTFGNGNAPTTEEFLDILQYICDKNIVVVNITQCVTGAVKMGLYETSAKLGDIGVVSGGDMTPEAAIGKLMYLLGKNLSIEEVKRQIQLDLRGERSLCEYEFKHSLEEYSYNKKIRIDIPRRIKDEDLIQAVARIKNISMENIEENEEVEFEITFSGYEVEKLEPMKIIKRIIRSKENLQEEILLTYKQNIKRLMELYKSLEFEIKCTKKFKSENINITIYSEAL